MLQKKLSELSASDIFEIVNKGVPEGPDLEFKRSFPSKGDDAESWQKHRKLGERAKNELADEIIAFANTNGGMLIVGIAEDSKTKQAISPLVPIPACKDAADRLSQALHMLIEPRLPFLECEGVITEEDKNSGVVIIRTSASYLAPHRNTQSLKSFVRRKDRAEPMSMADIQSMTIQVSRRYEQMEKAIESNRKNFFLWLPHAHRKEHPELGVGPTWQENSSGASTRTDYFGLRIIAYPLQPVPFSKLFRSSWIEKLQDNHFIDEGGHRYEFRINRSGRWTPNLRSVERKFSGDYIQGRDTIHNDGKIDRFVLVDIPSYPGRLVKPSVEPGELIWNLASILFMVENVRRAGDRPSQEFAVEVEMYPSAPLEVYFQGRGSVTGPNPISRNLLFPRYEISEKVEFNDLLSAFNTDLCNAAGYEPDWIINIDWNASEQ